MNANWYEMESIDRRIIQATQSGFPLVPRPFAAVASGIGLEEERLIARLADLLETGVLTRFGPFFNAERMGGGFTLAAMRVPADRYEAVAGVVNAQEEVAHNYAREHELNMWFVVATQQREAIREVLTRIESLTGLAVFDLPKLEEYRLGFQLRFDDSGGIDTAPFPPEATPVCDAGRLPDPLEQRLITATQAGLPLDPEPYRRVGETIGLETATVCDRLRGMLACGWIRRIGVATNHYRLGLTGNGMSVWDVPDHKVSELGRRVGEMAFVTHCYRRPRHPPDWPYNLFVMVHGPDGQTVETRIGLIASLLGADNRGHKVLLSSRILKKTGLRFRAAEAG